MPESVRKAARSIPALGPVPVLIGIARDAQGKPVDLFLSSEAQAHPFIWWAPGGKQVKPWHPESVLWLAEDLRSGEEVHIVPEPNQHAFFQSPSFKLDKQHAFATTGHVKSMASGAGKVQLWVYNVELSGGQVSKPLTLDPVIIIVRDP
jgi:hypothetical protein